MPFPCPTSSSSYAGNYSQTAAKSADCHHGSDDHFVRLVHEPDPDARHPSSSNRQDKRQIYHGGRTYQSRSVCPDRLPSPIFRIAATVSRFAGISRATVRDFCLEYLADSRRIEASSNGSIRGRDPERVTQFGGVSDRQPVRCIEVSTNRRPLEEKCHDCG